MVSQASNFNTIRIVVDLKLEGVGTCTTIEDCYGYNVKVYGCDAGKCSFMTVNIAIKFINQSDLSTRSIYLSVSWIFQHSHYHVSSSPLFDLTSDLGHLNGYHRANIDMCMLAL